MIPKIIHYCWFGKKPKPKDVLNCIKSWKKYLPDYEIKEWNEENYDVYKCQYMADAYKENKWAFVSDYCRLDVVYNYGGVYFDTDVEVIKSFNSLLQEDLFCGFEIRDKKYMAKRHIDLSENIAFGLGFGAVKNHPALKKMLDFYTTLSFYKSNGDLNLIACPIYQTQVLEEYGLKANGKTQRFDGGIAYSADFFCPQSNVTTQMLCMTHNTFSIHHYTATWTEQSKVISLRNRLSKYIGYKYAYYFSRLYYIKLLYKDHKKRMRNNF